MSRASCYRRLIAFWLGFIVALPNAQADGPTALEIRRLEAFVKMPVGASPLASYARFYTTANRDQFQQLSRGSNIVWGIYLSAHWRDQKPGVHITEFHKMPIIADGGCGVINVYFDRRSRQVIEIYCNAGLWDPSL